MVMINIIGLVIGGMLLMQGILSESYVKIALSILCLFVSVIGLTSLLEKK